MLLTGLTNKYVELQFHTSHVKSHAFSEICIVVAETLGLAGAVLSVMASKATRSIMAAALHSTMRFSEKLQRT